MSDFFYAFIVSIITMTIFDGLWLGFVAPKFYKKHIGFIMADKPNWYAATAFYVIFVIGVTVFVVYPGWKSEDSLIKFGLLGGLFGLVTYATYDLTNQATLKKWPWVVTLVDISWGMIITAAVSVISLSFLRIIFN